LIAKSHPWQLSAIAVAAILGLWTNSAAALSLGRITVQSALGEPLKAEIDILDINADEAASLVTRVAAPETFRAAGLDYNAAMGNLQTSLQRRPNGQAFIKLSSERTINDPFVDMILETSWSSGRIVRDYTLLFDPPNLRSANMGAANGQLPAMTAPPATPARPVAPAAANERPAIETSPLAPAAQPKPAVAATPRPTSQAPAATGQTQTTETARLTVKAGDTAGLIAAANKPANVSLDQMLVALLRANPDAFIKDNVNRIKAGAVLDLPGAEQASSTPPAQASQIIIAQSQDFNDFRRKFASNAPTATVAPAGRDISGKVQATVQEKKPAAAANDKLTLSKGAVTAKSNEEQLAKARNAAEAANRSAELAKNISDLSKLAAASGATAAASASAAAKPAVPAVITSPVAPVAPVASAATPAASAVAPVASATAAIASAAVSAQATASKPKRPVVLPPPEPVPEPGFLDSLLDNPLLPVAGAALLALLAGFGLFKLRQRKKATSIDNTNMSGPDSFLAVSGGQSVDTSDHLTNGSSMVYSPSQLDAVDEVDPVAEADVYMAYGRDLQAEEILKDALRHNPQRLAIHQKLLEIYAKRRDVKTFESIATLAFNLTNGSGSDWEQICDKGLAIDPDNALYLPGGQPYAKPTALTGPAPFDAMPKTSAVPTATRPTENQASGGAPDLDLDLDLDFSADDDTASPVSAAETTQPLPPIAAGMLDLPDLNFDDVPAPQAAPEPEPEVSVMGDLDFSLPAPSAEPELGLVAPDAAPPAGKPASSPNMDLMEFDLGSLSLDLDEEPVTVAGSLPDENQDPLETKLALAEEFRAIGDDDGARALIEEVIAEAGGDMKARAQRALGQL